VKQGKRSTDALEPTAPGSIFADIDEAVSGAIRYSSPSCVCLVVAAVPSRWRVPFLYIPSGLDIGYRVVARTTGDCVVEIFVSFAFEEENPGCLVMRPDERPRLTGA
jgi:hypothetical protein